MTTPLYALKDLEMRGTLDRFLKGCIANGRSVRDVAAHLSKKGTPISVATTYRWMSQASDTMKQPIKQRRGR